MMAGYIKGGVAAFPLAVALAGTTLATPMLAQIRGRPTTRFLQGTIGIGVIGLLGLICIGHYFGQFAGLRAIVLLLTPLLCWISELPGLRSKSPWQKSAIRLIAVTISLAAVLYGAIQDFDQKMVPLLAGGTPHETEVRHRLYRTTFSGFFPVILVTTLQTPSTISSSTSGAHPTGDAYCVRITCAW